MDKETEQLILKKLQLDYLSLHAVLTDLEKIISALVVDLDPRVGEIQRIQDQIRVYLRESWRIHQYLYLWGFEIFRREILDKGRRISF